MMASKGPDAEGMEVRSVVEEARRSVAEGPPVAVPWMVDAANKLDDRVSDVFLSATSSQGIQVPLDRNWQLPRAWA